MSINESPDRVWPSGLTTPEAEELQRGLVDGTRIFGLIALLAHFFAYVYSPWLK
jgi:light-harvesting protein B-800-850 beta chain